MSWPPHITVATVIQRADKFLMVEEIDADKQVFNQPAGHLDPNETLFAAAIRETVEETAWLTRLTGFVGVYHYYSDHNDTTYLRFCFVGEVIEKRDTGLDKGIVAAHWLTIEDIRAKPLRSPLVLQSIEDALNQPLLPLDRVKQF